MNNQAELVFTNITRRKPNDERRIIMKTKVDKKVLLKQGIVKVTLATVALLCLGVGYNIFLVANNLNLGGFTGLAQVLAQFNLNYSWTLLALNIAPFAVALWRKEWGFFFGSLAMTGLLGVFLDYFPMVDLQLSFFLSMVIGSILGGLGFGLIVRAKASTGGSDMCAMLIQKITKTKITVGTIMFAIDLVVIILWKAVVPSSSFFMSFIAMLLCNVFIDVAIYWGRLHEMWENYAWIVRKPHSMVQSLITRVKARRFERLV